MGLSYAVGTALAISACCHCPKPTTPPGAQIYRAPLAATECRVAEKMLRALARRHKSGNVVFSPHAVTRAAAVLASLTRGAARAELLEFLGERDLERLIAALSDAEPGFFDPLHTYFNPTFVAQLRAYGVEKPDAFDLQAEAEQPLFEYFSTVKFWGFSARELDRTRGLLNAESIDSDGGASSAQRWDALPSWLQRALPGDVDVTRRLSARAGLVSAIELKLAGVPSDAAGPLIDSRRGYRIVRQTFDAPSGAREVDFLRLKGGPRQDCLGDRDLVWWAPADYGQGTMPPADASGPAFVTVIPGRQLADWQGPLPLHQCEGVRFDNTIKVNLDFRVPTFCTRTTLQLEEIAPALGISFLSRAVAPASVSVTLPAALELDERGTFNRPKQSATSPAELLDFSPPYRKDKFVVDQPFLVTVHNRRTGAIFYVAWIEEPGPC